MLINFCVAFLFLFWLVITDFKKSSQNYKVPKSELIDSNKKVLCGFGLCICSNWDNRSKGSQTSTC
jgi:hypothetical protein